MAYKRKKTSAPPEVIEFLSEQGKKGGKLGGNIVRRFIQLGKQAASESGEDVRDEVEQNLDKTSRR